MMTSETQPPKFGDKLEDLNLTSDEIRRLSEAMRKAEFRELLAEYAKEISDPENKRKYEEEIRQMEAERGVDVKFVTPTPGYVIKTVQNGDAKCFVNICHSNMIKEATVTWTTQNGKKGESWSIPYSTAPGREDLDKTGGKCFVYDCVFNENTYNKGLKNARFRKLLHDTALQGIESQLNVKLDKVNLKFPKLKFKGMVQPTVIRSKSSVIDGETSAPQEAEKSQTAMKSSEENSGCSPASSDLSKEEIEEKIKFPYPYPIPGEPREVKVTPSESPSKKNKNTPHTDVTTFNGKQYVVPMYTLIHRGYVDIQTCTDDRDSKMHATRPKELVLYVVLPLLNSTKTVSLDVLRKQLILHSDEPAAYRLDIALPYEVEEDRGVAKFDKSKHKLTVTLPVVKPATSSGVSIPIEEEVSQQAPLVQELSGSSEAAGDRSTHAEASPTESFDDSSAPEESHLPEADQPEKKKVKSRLGNADEYFASWEPPVLRIPPDIERRLEQIPDSVFDHDFPSKTSEFPTDPFQIEMDLPNYSFDQRPDQLSFILHEPEIRKDQLDIKPFKNDDGLHIKFCSLGADKSNCRWFYVYIEFEKTEMIDRNKIATNVNASNAVILLNKVPRSQKLWSYVKIGPCRDNLTLVYLKPRDKIKDLARAVDEGKEFENNMRISEPNSTSHKYSATLLPSDKESMDQSAKPFTSKTAEEVSKMLADGTLESTIATELAAEADAERETRPGDFPRDESGEVDCSKIDFNKMSDADLNHMVDTIHADLMQPASVAPPCPGNDADEETNHHSDGSPRSTANDQQNSALKKESKAARKRRSKQKNRARTLSQSSDEGGVKDQENKKGTNNNGRNGNQDDDLRLNLEDRTNRDRNLSVDSTGTDNSPLPSPGGSFSCEEGAVRIPRGKKARRYGSNSKGTKSCTEPDDSDGEHSSMRKSVSFSDQVDVVNIRTVVPNKNNRNAAKKSKRKQKKRNDESDDDIDSVEVKEEATWNKVPLSSSWLTFDLD